METILTKENIEKHRAIAIYGNVGTGKTALVFHILSLLEGKKVYFVKYPKPENLKKFGYENMISLEEFENLQDCVVYWDEPQLSTSIYDKKKNEIIAKVCSLARQRNILLIVSSSDTRVFTKHNEDYFDLWLLKNVNYNMVKRGSVIKDIIRENTFIEPSGFKLNTHEFVIYSTNFKEINGKAKFDLIDEWNESLSKPYYNG